MTQGRNWRLEHRLLILLARTTLSEHELVEAEQLLTRNLDWSYLVNMAISHGIPQLAYHGLVRMQVERSVPVEIVRRLEDSYRANALRHGRMTTALRNTIRALQQRGVDVVVLKGMALASFVYPEPALRQCGDIDILVRREDLEVAKRTLTQHLGYAPVATPSAGLPHHQAYLKDGRIMLELHWEVLPQPYPFKLEVTELWRRRQPITIAGARTWTLLDEDLLLHLCLHATFHRKLVQEHVGLRHFCDIAETVRVLDIDWRRLVRTADEWRMHKHCYVALYISRNLLRAAVPIDSLRELRPELLDSKVMEDMMERVLLRHEVPSRIPPRFVRLLAAPTFARRLRVLGQILVPTGLAARGRSASGRRWLALLLRPWQVIVRWRGFLWHFIRHYRSMAPFWVRRQVIDEWLERTD